MLCSSETIFHPGCSYQYALPLNLCRDWVRITFSRHNALSSTPLRDGTVHFQGEPLGDGVTWDTWTSRMEGKLRAWYADSYTEAGNNELVEFALSRGLMTLHRPSPRTPIPSQRSLLVAFEVAASSARSHKDHISTGFFSWPWISAHHTLEGAVVILFCLLHACTTISQKFGAG